MWLLKEKTKSISYSQLFDKQKINPNYIKFNGVFGT